MRLGLNYDTGFAPGGRDSRPGFTAADAARDLQLIAGLGAQAVRITGHDPARIEAAAVQAAARGLAVWFAPFPCELDPAATTAVFVESAERAERLRRDGADVTLVLGCELSLFGQGYLPGADVYARIDGLRSEAVGRREVRARLDAFLAAAVATVRPLFAGPLTYASGPWEDVDWSPFDVIGVDAYRDRTNAATYRGDLHRRVEQAAGTPVAVTEFGCCTFRGAAAMGGLGWTVIDRETGELEPWVVHNEDEPAAYLRECVEAMQAAGVAIAFWFTFASWGGDGSDAADAPAYGLMRVGSDGALSGKAASREFARLARAVRAAAATS